MTTDDERYAERLRERYAAPVFDVDPDVIVRRGRRRRTGTWSGAGAALVVVALAWSVIGLPRWIGPGPAATPPPEPADAEAALVISPAAVHAGDVVAVTILNRGPSGLIGGVGVDAQRWDGRAWTAAGEAGLCFGDSWNACDSRIQVSSGNWAVPAIGIPAAPSGGSSVPLGLSTAGLTPGWYRLSMTVIFDSSFDSSAAGAQRSVAAFGQFEVLAPPTPTATPTSTANPAPTTTAPEPSSTPTLAAQASTPAADPWALFAASTACTGTGTPIPYPARPVLTLTALDACRAVVTGPKGLQGIIASGQVVTLNPLAGLYQVTAATGAGAMTWVGGVDSSLAPILLEVSSAGARQIRLPAGATYVASATVDGSTPWFALTVGGGGSVGFLKDGSYVPAASLNGTPVALAVHGDQLAVAVTGPTGDMLLSGTAGNLTSNQLVPAGLLVRSMTATSDGFVAAAQHNTDGAPDSATFFVRSFAGPWNAVQHPGVQLSDVAAIGSVVYVSGGDAAGARLWSSDDGMATLRPFTAVPAGESGSNLSAAGPTLWVVGDHVTVLTPTP